MWMTCTNKSYDFAYHQGRHRHQGPFPPRNLCRKQPRGSPDRRRLFSWRTESRSRPGPHKHAIQQTFFLYVYEPGGNRVEIANAGARLILAPDWKPIRGPRRSGRRGRRGASRPIESFHIYGTPAVPEFPGSGPRGPARSPCLN
jgi:catechol 2,3-dioxygenase